MKKITLTESGLRQLLREELNVRRRGPGLAPDAVDLYNTEGEHISHSIAKAIMERSN